LCGARAGVWIERGEAEQEACGAERGFGRGEIGGFESGLDDAGSELCAGGEVFCREPAGAEGDGGAHGGDSLGDLGVGEPEAEGFGSGVVRAGDGEERFGGICEVGEDLVGLLRGGGEARELVRLGGRGGHGRVGDHGGIVP